MDIFKISGFISLLINGALGLFVLFKNPKRALNIRFAAFSLCIALWSVGSAYVNVIPNEKIALWSLRQSYLFAVFVPSLFFHFVTTFIGWESKFKTLLKFSYLISIVLLCFVFTPNLIPSFRVLPSFNYRIDTPGSAYVAFSAFFNIVVFGTLLLLVYFYFKEANAKQKKQLGFIFVGYFFGAIAGLEYFLSVFNILKRPPIDDYLLIVTFASMAYGITRHQLLDIEIIIKKTLVFAGIVATAVGIVSLPIGLVQLVIGRKIGVSPFWLMVSGIATTALIYRPLARWLTNLTDRYLFQKKVNYRKLLKEATEYLAQLVSLRWQARRVISFLVYKARIRNASIYAFQSNAPGSLLLQAARPKIQVQGHKTILFSHPIITHMLNQVPRGSLQFSEIEEARKLEKDVAKQNELNEILHLFKEHKAEAAIPCFVSDTERRTRKKPEARLIRGILFLGPQKSDELYREEDLDVFFTLGQESSIAFENARLYDEKIERARELEEINEKLNSAQTELMHSLDETERARKEEQHAKEEALAAKKKTEEMEVELLRRQRLLIVEKLVRGLAHEIFNAVQPMTSDLDLAGQVFTDYYELYDKKRDALSSDEHQFLVNGFKRIEGGLDRLHKGLDHIVGVVDTLNQMRKGDDKTIKAFDFATFWIDTHTIILMQTHGEILEEVPVEEDIPPNLPPVLGNPVQLTQVFLNLYRNALYAMNGCPEKKLSISAHVEEDDPNYLTIKFSDTGCGVSLVILSKIFDFGFSTKGEQGQGIGLNICRTIIERFGGTIVCESEVGKGTAFTIKLPLAKAKEHAD